MSECALGAEWLARTASALGAPVAPFALSQAAAAGERVRAHAAECEALHLDAFRVVDVSHAPRRLRAWSSLFPDVMPFYAVKCNPDPGLLAGLAACGSRVGFDCASVGELRAVLGLGVAPERIIYAHPMKHVDEIRFALAAGVRAMTLDSRGEVDKMVRAAAAERVPLAELLPVLRLRVPDGHAVCPLGEKFGATIPRRAVDGTKPSLAEHCESGDGDTDALSIAAYAHSQGCAVRGLSFHVGSGCTDAGAFSLAIELASCVARAMAVDGLPRIDLLDIGGGFPGAESTCSSEGSSAAEGGAAFDVGAAFGWQATGGGDKAPSATREGATDGVGAADAADATAANDANDATDAMDAIGREVRAAVAAFFPRAAFPGLRVIAEPGRFFAGGCQVICAQVFSVRRRAGGVDAFIGEGLLGAFKDVALVGAAFRPSWVDAADGAGCEVGPVTLRGPSGRPQDVVCPQRRSRVPREGEWLAFGAAGAYTTAIASVDASTAVRAPALYLAAAAGE